jgi:hypothetical protein
MTGGSRRPRRAELASFAALIMGRGRCAGTAGLSHSVAQNRKLARTADSQIAGYLRRRREDGHYSFAVAL